MVQVPVHRTLKALGALARPGTVFALLLLVAVRAFAGTASLAWDPVASPALVGYMVYYGPSAGNYPTRIDVGNTTTYTVPNLVEGATYHFAATAYDASHTESGYSNDASATVPYSAPVAQFTASTTSGTAPLALNFTSTSTGTITTYAWNFGDAGTSSVQNPSHVYAAAGVYTVSLTVSGPGGSNTQTRTNYITVSVAAPVAGFTADTTSGTPPLSVNFTSTSTGTITTYAWNFGDAGTSSVQNPSHVYAAAGVYTVSLTVSGPGGSNTQTRTNYITVSAAAPVAGFTANTTSGTAPLSVNFTSTSTGTITTYAWNFGDAGTSSVQNPSHVYAAAGVYSVSLTVSGPGGSNTQTRTNYITVSVPAPVAGFTADTTSGTPPMSVNFTNTSTGTITTYAWNFGDAGTSGVQNPSHVYAAAGVYTVSLTVSGPGGSNTQTRTNYITVSAAAPVAGFTANTTSGTAPMSVNFTSTSTGTITTYAWNFGDASTSSVQNPSHVYAAAGVYTVGLTVSGPGGSNTQTRTNYISVSVPAPVAGFTADTTFRHASDERELYEHVDRDDHHLRLELWRCRHQQRPESVARVRCRGCVHGESDSQRPGRQQHPDADQLHHGLGCRSGCRLYCQHNIRHRAPHG